MADKSMWEDLSPPDIEIARNIQLVDLPESTRSLSAALSAAESPISPMVDHMSHKDSKEYLRVQVEDSLLDKEQDAPEEEHLSR